MTITFAVSSGGKENKEKEATAEGPMCATVGCGKPAPLQCPKCIELKLKPAHFCSQPCFKSSYSTHKLVHSTAAAATNGANNNKRVCWRLFTNPKTNLGCTSAKKYLAYLLYGSVASLPSPSSSIEAWPYSTFFRFASLLHLGH